MLGVVGIYYAVCKYGCIGCVECFFGMSAMQPPGSVPPLYLSKACSVAAESEAWSPKL